MQVSHHQVPPIRSIFIFIRANVEDVRAKYLARASGELRWPAPRFPLMHVVLSTVYAPLAQAAEIFNFRRRVVRRKFYNFLRFLGMSKNAVDFLEVLYPTLR